MNSPGQYMSNMLLDKSGEKTPERMKTWSQSKKKKKKNHPVVDVTGDRSKVQCCKEEYCIGTSTVRPMNHCKLEVVKQDMARVNINILGISELKQTGSTNLTQMTIMSTTVDRNPLEEMA